MPCGVRYAHAGFVCGVTEGRRESQTGRSKTELVKDCDTVVHEVSPRNLLFLIITGALSLMPLASFIPVFPTVHPESKAMI